MKPRRLSWFSRPPRWARFVLYAVAIGFIVWAWLPNWSDLSSSEAPVIIKKAGEPDSYNVTVGDVVVKMNHRVIRGPNEMNSLTVHPDTDARFVFSRSLGGIVLFFEEGHRNGQYDDVVGTSATEPSLYPAPSSMSVYRHPVDGAAAIIRVNGSLFLGSQLYVVCSLTPVLPTLTSRNCQVTKQLTDRTYLTVGFYDVRYPVDEWPALMSSLETGLRSIAVY